MLGSRFTVPVLLVLAGLGGWGCRSEGSAHTLSTIPITTVPDRDWIAVQNPTFDRDQQPRDTLHLVNTLADTLTLGFVRAMAAVGEYVVLTDRYVEPKLIIVNAKAGEVVRRVGRDGRGPREFRTPYSLAVQSHDPPKVWVFDYDNQRLTLLAPDRPDREWAVEEISLKLDVRLTHPFPNAAGFASTGLFPDHTLMELDRSARPLRLIRALPPYDQTAASTPVGRLMLNYAVAARHPQGGRFVLAYRHANRLDVFDEAPLAARSTSGPRSIVPRYGADVRTGRFGFGQGNERAYVWIDATPRSVFALFCGNCSRERPPTIVHMFDWAGTFVREFALDHGMWVYAVTQDERSLIGVFEDDQGMPRIGRWNLSGLGAANH